MLFRFAIVSLIALALFGLSDCKDQGKESANRAAQNVTMLLGLIDKDVAELERGMPEGSKRLGAILLAKGADPRQDLAAVRSALKKVRREVVDLNIAKSTFFALADEKGIAIRNDLEEDVMAGQNLIAMFPDLAKAQAGQFVTTTGAFPSSGNGLPGRAGPDKDWLAAAPVKRDDGTLGAIFVSGWSYRYFARHLSETLRSQIADEAKAAGTERKLPVFYVAVFDKSGVYSAPATPQVNEKTMADVDLVAKTAGGPFQGSQTITDRTFGYAAARAPRLCAECGIVVLRSEI